MKYTLLPILLLVVAAGSAFARRTRNSTSTATPVVLWHGMGDCCCNPLSMGSIKRLLKREISGVYVHSLEIGNNVIEDTLNGFFKNVNDQVEIACSAIASDSNLQNGYNALGFSQGGQFLRAVAERCPDPPMINLITFGGQHQGVFGVPKCFSDEHAVCEKIRDELSKGAYNSHVQNAIVQAEYWHDPTDEKEYVEKSIFIADINNERVKNATYKENLQKLTNFVMVRFNNDTMVQPVASEWFGFYKPGQDVEVMSLQESPLYQEDWLGLQAMDQDGKLQFLDVDGDHLEFTDQWFTENIVDKYLK